MVLEKIAAALSEQGASQVAVISAKNVIVDERVRLKCQIPLCDSFNRNLMCPPRLPAIATFRKALANFKHGILIQVMGRLVEQNDAFNHARLLHDLVHIGEKAAFEKEFRFAAGLIGGPCRLCGTCVAAEPRATGMACRYPFKARPSMEAMGIDVFATMESAGWSSAFPVTDQITWTGLILV